MRSSYWEKRLYRVLAENNLNLTLKSEYFAMRALLPAVLLFVSVAGVEGERSVTKSGVPSSMFRPGMAGISMFHVLSADFRGIGLADTTLTSIDWDTTGYPSSSGEKVEICYRRPASGTDTHCKEIAANSTGRIEEFNVHRFAPGAAIVIKHRASVGPMNSRPAGRNTVTFNFRY
jgi:hypothetical protein